jgi:hypothetical protein
LHGISLETEAAAVLFTLVPQMRNLEVVRVVRGPLSVSDVPFPTSVRHLILSIDRDWSWYNHLQDGPQSLRSITAFLNEPSGYDRTDLHARNMPQGLGNITVVSRRRARPVAPRGIPWPSHGFKLLHAGVRLTFVNLHDTMNNDELQDMSADVLRGGEMAPMRFGEALRRAIPSYYKLYSGQESDEIELLGRNVRDWLAEASEDDREAYLNFW